MKGVLLVSKGGKVVFDNKCELCGKTFYPPDDKWGIIGDIRLEAGRKNIGEVIYESYCEKCFLAVSNKIIRKRYKEASHV